MSAFRALVNDPFLESFDTTFMGNKKNCQNINCFFFPYKLSLNESLAFSHMIIVSNPCKCMDAFKIKHNFYYKNIYN